MNGRERTRLARAREVGYLDARCRNNRALIHAYGLWCWRLKIPMVWVERRTPCSRFGRVQLEMFTSANRLSVAGEALISTICAPANTVKWTRVSPHEACWDHVALANAGELAHAVFRVAIRPENLERNERRAGGGQEQKTGKILRMA